MSHTPEELRQFADVVQTGEDMHYALAAHKPNKAAPIAVALRAGADAMYELAAYKQAMEEFADWDDHTVIQTIKRRAAEILAANAQGERRTECVRSDELLAYNIPTKGDTKVLISTLDGEWFVCEVRGAVFVSWVQKSDKEHAAKFPAHAAEKWLEVLCQMTGRNDLVLVGS